MGQYFVYEALRAAYPLEIRKLYAEQKGTTRVTPPAMPVIEVLNPSVTIHQPLGKIKHDESTNSGNIAILENIFVRQYELPPSSFSDSLKPVFGDQKTVARLRSVKARRKEESDPYNSFRWVLPIPALFHLKMNLIALIHKTFFQEENHRGEAWSLAYSRDSLNRKKIGSKGSNFFDQEEFIIHNFQARVLAVMDAQSGKGPRSDDTFPFAKTTPEELNIAIEHTASKLLEVSLDEDENIGNEYWNHVQFLRITFSYLLLKYSVKHGDIGLLRRAITYACFYFNGSKQHNYAYETLYLFHLTCTEAADPCLQQAILANGLINWQGKDNTWWETDRGVEVHNGNMKAIIRGKRTSNQDLDYLFDYCALNSAFYSRLRGALYSRFGADKNDDHQHIPKSAEADIRRLAMQLKSSILPGTDCTYRVANLFHEGAGKLCKNVESFNSRSMVDVDDQVEIEDSELRDFYDRDATTETMLIDKGLDY
jgi:uncharacterized protein DUF6589